MEPKFRIHKRETFQEDLLDTGCSSEMTVEQQYMVKETFGKSQRHYWRVREQSSTACVSHHRMVEKREYRTAVEDAAATKRIRKELGFPEELAVENRRTVFVREDIHVVLDKKT